MTPVRFHLYTYEKWKFLFFFQKKKRKKLRNFLREVTPLLQPPVKDKSLQNNSSLQFFPSYTSLMGYYLKLTSVYGIIYSYTWH